MKFSGDVVLPYRPQPMPTPKHDQHAGDGGAYAPAADRRPQAASASGWAVGPARWPFCRSVDQRLEVAQRRAVVADATRGRCSSIDS